MGSRNTAKVQFDFKKLNSIEIATIIFNIKNILYNEQINPYYISKSKPFIFLDLILFYTQRFIILIYEQLRIIYPKMNVFYQQFKDLQLKCLRYGFFDINFCL